MLKFFGVTFDLNRYVICIRQQSLVTREEKKWAGGKKVAIEGVFNIFKINLLTDNPDIIYENSLALLLYKLVMK